MRNISTLPRLVSFLREWRDTPDPDCYSPNELATIWIFNTCIADVYGEHILMFHKEYEYLGKTIAARWNQIDAYLRISMTYTAVTTGDFSDINWTEAYNAWVVKRVGEYMKFMEGRFAKLENVQGDQSGYHGLSRGEVDNEVHSLSQGS